MKVVIWALAVIGLAMPCLLSVVVLTAHLQHRLYLLRNPPEPGITVLMGGLRFGLGRFTGCGYGSPNQLELCNSVIPPILTLFGASLFLVGLFFLIPQQPQVVRRDGLDQIEVHIHRMLRSPRAATHLFIGTADGEKGIGVDHTYGVVSLSFHPSVKPPDGTEEPIRRYFAARGIDPTSDYLAANGGVEGATRCLEYRVPHDAATVTQMCREILVDIEGIGPTEWILFHYM